MDSDSDLELTDGFESEDEESEVSDEDTSSVSSSSRTAESF